MKFKIFGIIFIFLFFTIGGSYIIFTYPYSSGTRSGKLVKLSKKGIIYPTYEGILDLGSGDKLTWEFSIHDRKLGEKLALQSGQNVQLNYDELFFKVLFETKYNVTSFKLNENAKVDGTSLHFCRLVNVMRRSLKVVEEIRSNIDKYDPELLDIVRGCQNR